MKNQIKEVNSLINIQNQIEEVNSLIIIQNQIALLKLKAKNCLQISINGGLFNITPELMAHVQLYIQRAYQSNLVGAVFLDKNDNPIKIDDLTDFLDKMYEREMEVLNEYYVEHEKLKKLKSPAEWLKNDD